MKLQFKKRRLLPVALAILVLVVGSGVAYAYWTSSGTGGGSGSVAAASASVTVNQAGDSAPTLAPMYPGDLPQTTHVTITNNSLTQSAHITTVSISAVTSAGGCTLSDFTVVPATVPAELQDIAATTTTIAFSGPTIHFLNDPLKNQDYCQNAALTLTFSASAS